MTKSSLKNNSSDTIEPIAGGVKQFILFTKVLNLKCRTTLPMMSQFSFAAVKLSHGGLDEVL